MKNDAEWEGGKGVHHLAPSSTKYTLSKKVDWKVQKITIAFKLTISGSFALDCHCFNFDNKEQLCIWAYGEQWAQHMYESITHLSCILHLYLTTWPTIWIVFISYMDFQLVW